MEHQTQVIIIGAGPTGLALASQLHRYGIDFVILDKNPETTHLSKAMVVHARTLEIFDEIGLADKAVRSGQIAERFSILSKGKIKGQMKIGAFGQGLSPFPFALILEQSKTEKLLAGHLEAAGVQVLWNSEVTRLEENGEGITATYRDSRGVQTAVKGKYLVGCDGASSTTRHSLGFGFAGDTQERIFYVADVRMESPLTRERDAWFVMIDKGFVLFFPMEGEKHYRVIGTVPQGLGGHENIEFSTIAQDLKAQMKIDVEFTEEIWFSTYKVHSRLTETFGKGRCFIAGDAAHIHTPAGGQGMNTGIQDAYNLAWKLAFVLQEKAPTALLDTYNEERRANAVNLLKTTDTMFDILAGTGRLTNFFRMNIFPTLIGLVTKVPFLNKRIFPMLSQIGISYPDSSLSIKSTLGKVTAGDRMPWFEANGHSVYDLLKAPAYKLLYFGSHSSNTFATLPSIVQHSFTEIPKIFKGNKNFYIVLRPDNHISYLGRDREKISKALAPELK